MLERIVVQVLEKMSCPHHQPQSGRGSYAKPSSLVYLHEDPPCTPERPPRTPERSSESSIVAPTPSAPRKPRRRPAESSCHIASLDYMQVPVFASTAMELPAILEATPDLEESSSSDGASHYRTPPRRETNEDDDGRSKSSRCTHPEYSASILRVRSLDAPDVFLDDDLSLLSYGPSLVIALDDQLFIYPKGRQQRELFTCTKDSTPISCVQWSPLIGQTDKSLLALGLEKTVQIWSVERGGTLLEFKGHSGFVTATCFKPDGTEMLAASSGAGIYRYNLLSEDPDKCSHYKGGEASTCIRWNASTDLIASAGNGLIRLWNAKEKRKNIEAHLTLPHTGVRCLEFCPNICHSLFASGGNDGVHLWDLNSGLLRASIATDAPVTAIVWSCAGEILVAHGNKLSLWNLDAAVKPRRIGQLETDGKILSMDQGMDGLIACLQDDETCNIFSIVGDSEMSYQGDSYMPQQNLMPHFAMAI